MKIILNKRIVSLVSILIIGVFTTLISCDKGDVSEDEYQIQYQREAQLKNTYENGISPLNAEFIASTEALKEATTVFKQERTIQNLEATRTKWIEALKIWKHLELYNLGSIENSFIHFEINRWETNTENIENYIEGTETINVSFISSIGSSSKGFSAIEYLLFSSENNNEILSNFTTNANAQRRLNYLESLVENLNTKANQLQTLWIDYKSEFISSLENGISGSQSQLTNAMITLTEEIVISKLGNALGDNSGGVINKDALEAFRSKASLIIIQEHLNALKHCYEGDFNTNSISWGYHNYLTLIGNKDLNTQFENAFSNCQNKIDAISNSLFSELDVNPERVIDLQNSFTDLLILIKVDMANAIGTTVTINDNDGD